jgi:GNAT superfamily N-acetyltransferase
MKIPPNKPIITQTAGIKPLDCSVNRLPNTIGLVIAHNGDRLVMRLVNGRMDSFQLRFFSESDQPVGYLEFLSGGSLLNYIYVKPAFRGKHYAEAFMDAALKGLLEKRLPTGLAYLRTYIRNPLIVQIFEARGFKIIDHTVISTRTEVVLGSGEGLCKIPLYVADLQQRESLRSYCLQPDNPDWHIFDVKDEPIQGKTMVVFAEYVLNDEFKLINHLASSPIQVHYY